MVDECLGTAAETWTVEPNGTILQTSGKCLNTQGEAITGGTLAGLAKRNGAGTHVWTYQPASSTLVNGGSGLCLYAPSAANGTQLQIDTCVSNVNQQRWLPALSGWAHPG